MARSERTGFVTIRTEGSFFTPDFQHAIFEKACGGTRAGDYHYDGEQLNEVISQKWAQLCLLWQRCHAANTPFDTVARERWLLPLFSALDFGRLQRSAPLKIGERTYPISYWWNAVPIHLVSPSDDLDTYAKMRRGGTARQSPYSLVQGLLNNAEKTQWGVVSNGLYLRLLRSDRRLAHQTYIEFDLQAMLEGEHYPDFVLFWLLCHESRFEQDTTGECWLESWFRLSNQQSRRALGKLRDGVEKAITVLGEGFLERSANQYLRQALSSGSLLPQEYYQQLLRLVYRLIILLVAEDRGVLFEQEVVPTIVQHRYREYYSISRLRTLAQHRLGTRHIDLFWCLRSVMAWLSGPDACSDLGLPVFNGFLFSHKAIPDIEQCELSNHALLEAIRALTFIYVDGAMHKIDYQHIGPEELGGIYENLLECHAVVDLANRSFRLETARGHDRKTTGSYYTPDSLVQSLLDSALEPILDRACQEADPQAALLKLKVCDPACGSGHFLIAAAQRIASRLASLRKKDEMPTKLEQCRALRDVVTHCIYGVDSNPMAVELCKFTLWMEALTPGLPLVYLENHIQCGDSLLGATPALIQKGIPDQAFNQLTGDDAKLCQEYRRRNKEGRAGQIHLLIEPMEVLLRHQQRLETISGETFAGIHQLDDCFKELKSTEEHRYFTFIANAWCAAFVWPMVHIPSDKKMFPITEGILREAIQKGQTYQDMLDESERLKDVAQYNFFQWYPAFPDVFRLPRQGEAPDNPDAGWIGGFDVVLCNPPWGRLVLPEKEWFAQFDTEIVQAPNSSQRKHMIKSLRESNPALYKSFVDEQRITEGKNHFLHNSGRYPLCGRKQINLYAVFVEMMRQIVKPTGRIGCLVPSGIATDDTTQYFFRNIMETRTLISLYDFENGPEKFPDVHRSYKFCLLTINGLGTSPVYEPDFAFFLDQTKELSDPDRHFSLSIEDIALLNPNTYTSPIVRSGRDIRILKAAYQRFPILFREEFAESNLWNITFLRMFDMANDSHLFRTRSQLEQSEWKLCGNTFYKGDDRFLPLYEGKMVTFYDHRFAMYETQNGGKVKSGKSIELTVEQHQQSDRLVIPQYWVHEAKFQEKVKGSPPKAWLAFRDVARSTDIRTAIVSIIPPIPCGHKLPIVLLGSHGAYALCYLVSCFSSFIFDYIMRQKIGGTSFSFFILKQLPVIPPSQYQTTCMWDKNTSIGRWLLPRVLELTYTAWDLAGFAQECGYHCPPFRWDEERRFFLRCELDAAYFHLYEIVRDDVDYIMDTFPIWREKDEKNFGEYRTKRVILEIYDEMQTACITGRPYQTRLAPPPADIAITHVAVDGIYS